MRIKFLLRRKEQLVDLGISEVRLYPAIAVPPEGEQRSQLLILLDRAKETWVDGVLRNSIHNEALIALGKRPIDEAVEPPWKHVVELSSQRSQLLLQDRRITTIFDATRRGIVWRRQRVRSRREYCTRYMMGTRGKGDVDTGNNNVGFRCVVKASD